MYSFLALTGVRIQGPPRKSKNPRTTGRPFLNKTNVLAFLVFFLPLQQHCDGSCYFIFPFISLNTIPHGSKTSSSCPAVFMLLSIEGPRAVFLFLRLRSEFSKPRSTNPEKWGMIVGIYRALQCAPTLKTDPRAVSLIPYLAE